MDIQQYLVVGVAIIFFIILVLIIAYWYLSMKNTKNRKTDEKIGGNQETSGIAKRKPREYTKIPVFDFMEFDNIEDNMIMQNGGKRYLMVIECNGINYDLMSEVEQSAVEAGFVQFLNTLRHPIQIYTQTRTINIGNSIEKYKEKIAVVKSELEQKQIQLNRTIQSEHINTNQIQQLRLEVARNQNLYDYGKDIVSNIEKMSLNKNVLKKHYYIIVPYYTSEIGVAELSEEEKRNMVFSELYTRCQSITRLLFACSIKSKILDSNELVDLLYVAYNRDESEVLTIEKAIKSGYNELYSTGPDALDRKMEAINKEIEKRAIELAQNAVEQVRSEKQKKVDDKEENINKLIEDLAKTIIKENKKYIGAKTAEDAIEKINKKENTKEGEKDNEKVKKTGNRRATKSN